MLLLPARSSGLSKESKAQAEQIRSIDVTRLVGVAGSLSPGLLEDLDDAIRLHLNLT